MRNSIVILVSIVAIGLFACGGGSSSGGADGQPAQSACTKLANWSHSSDQVCSDCAQNMCAPEIRSLMDRAATCQSQFDAADGCGSNCSCIDNALTASDCKSAFNGFLTCWTNKCDSPCK